MRFIPVDIPPSSSSVLGLLVREWLPRHRKLAQLVSNHIFRDAHIVVNLAIVHLKDETNEVGKDGGTPCLGLDGRDSLARLRTDNG